MPQGKRDKNGKLSYDLRCVFCNKRFKSKRVDAKYCSANCRTKVYADKKRNIIKEE